MTTPPTQTSSKRLPVAIWIGSAIVLVVAVFPLPYGYYTFTRIITCLTCGIFAFTSLNAKPPAPSWGVIFVGIAVLFNPLVPIYLNRQTWFWIDLTAAASNLAHMVLVRGLKRSGPS